MNKVYWHFNGGTVASDEDGAADSLMLPVDKITGITPGTRNSDNINKITIWFEKASVYSHIYQNSDIVSMNGNIALSIQTGKQKEVMMALADLANPANNKKAYITIANDRTDDQEAEYAHPFITGCNNIISV